MMNYSLPKLICSVVLFSGLLACGGGGGGKDRQDDDTGLQGATDTSLNFPIEAATVAFLSRASSYTLTANLDNDTFRLTSMFAPGTEGVEPILSDEPLKSYLFTETIEINNDAPVQDRSIFYYSTNPLEFWGESFEGEPEEFLPPTAATSRTRMPATARVGQSGELGVWPDAYLDENNNLVDAPSTMRWKVQGASTNTAWLCIETQSRDADGTYTADRCIRINQAGDLLGYKADYSFPDISLAFR